MKNMVKLFGVIALVAVIGFSMAACDTGGGGTSTGGGSEPASAKYVSTDSAGNTYELEITKAGSRAVYTPQNGDAYVLTIIYANNTTKTSRGTVTIENTTTFKLTPTGGSGTIITVTIVNTGTAVLITGISGTVEGQTITASNMIPVKEFKTFDLKAEKFPNIECWTNGIKLSDLSAYTPKKGDKLTFKISGKTKEPLKWFSNGLQSRLNEAPWIIWLGGPEGEYIKEIPATFDTSFTIELIDDPSVKGDVYVFINNILWQVGDGDNADWKHESGFRLQDSDAGKVKAAISDFRISLVQITPK